MKKMKKNGFSLIELMVAISIAALLTYIGFISYTNSLRKSRDGRRQTDLEMIRGALEIYRADNDLYPYQSGVGSNFAEMMNTLYTNHYLNTNVRDPQAPTRYYYYGSASGTSYLLCAFMERSAANTCSTSPTYNCSATEVCNYGVVSP